MLINKDTALSTSRVLLVPYEAHHVPVYHEWMKDEEIQALTASEPLTLPAEYAMQASWRHDADKLTFIICAPLPSPSSLPPTIRAGEADSPTTLLGDVNLFLSPGDSPTAGPTGELELMIALPAHRRRGYGRAALLTFLRYISVHQTAILAEYAPASAPEQQQQLQLTVKITATNVQSTALFESIGFVRVGDGPNYFGELELAAPRGFLAEEHVRALCERWHVDGYEECEYVRGGEGAGILGKA